MLTALAATLLVSAMAFHILSRRGSSAARSIRGRHGIPDGEVVYSDLDRPARALFSRRYGISGKPDYIIKDTALKAIIPVEVKSGQAKKPYANHVLQLAAYCLLVEENYHKPVPYGIIVYADGKQHKVHFDSALRSELLCTVQEMRMRRSPRGNDHIERCRFCSLKTECERLQLKNGAIDGPMV